MSSLPVYLVIIIGLGIAMFLGLVLQLLLIRKSKGKRIFVKYKKPRTISPKHLYYPYGLRTNLAIRKSSEPERYETYFDYALNIDPKEKESIMRLPCCGVYAHIHHIEQWLEKNSKCPNCHQNLNKIFRNLS